MGAGLPEAAHTLAAYDELSDMDIIHDHTVLGPLMAAAHGSPQPAVVTNHGPFTSETRPVYAEIARHAAVVAISHSQAGFAGEVPIAAVIHHGIDLSVYRPGPGAGGYLLFVGRMSPDKGVHRAVRVARRAGRRLVIVTRILEPGEHRYFDEVVRPMLGAGDEVVTDVSLPKRLDLLGRADALLNPIRWPEPFGLVMAEALSCATPVLVTPCGAAPEIVDHGVTGYLCRDEDAMVAAIDDVPGLDRGRCRAAAERRFSLERMAADHERLYRAVLRAGAPGKARA